MRKMTLKELGYQSSMETYRQKHQLMHLAVGRVIAEHRERYIVKTPEREYDAEIIGNLRFTAHSRSDFPAVGDWVCIQTYDEDKALIHVILPRQTVLARQAVGHHGEKQIIATNLDGAFIVQAIDRDFNINRIQRYLTLCLEAGIEPFLILNKIDLIDDDHLASIIESVKKRAPDLVLIPLSNHTKAGIDQLNKMIVPGQTYCLLGSSGVGKSTLINVLADKELMATNTISTSNHKGRHVTTHRELIILEGGGIVIDNPGMREVGLTDVQQGLETTFSIIHELADRCKYKDCSHINESDCAVLAAVEQGLLAQADYDHFQKLSREQMHYESSSAEKRRKEKVGSKLVKYYKNAKKRNQL